MLGRCATALGCWDDVQLRHSVPYRATAFLALLYIDCAVAHFLKWLTSRNTRQYSTLGNTRLRLEILSERASLAEAGAGHRESLVAPGANLPRFDAGDDFLCAEHAVDKVLVTAVPLQHCSKLPCAPRRFVPEMRRRWQDIIRAVRED